MGDLICKKCGRAIDVFEREKSEGMCKDCFMEIIKKRVHPF
jgi:NMD protein affecting ribosome stability and mRNA decay